jgi:Domain of Unknown Function (DUF1521)
MQAAMQINSPLLSLQANLSLLGGNAQSHLSSATGLNSGRAMPQFASATGFNGGNALAPLSPAAGRNQPSQMSNMMGGFSKTSYSVFGQSTGNGQSSTFYAQSTTINRAQSALPQSVGRGGIGIHDARNGSARDCRVDTRTSISDRTQPRNDCGCHDSGRTDQAQWSNTPVSNNKSSINLGDYKLDFNKSDSSMVMTNSKTGDKTKIYGDPHLTQHVNGSDSNSSTAMFNGPMTFMLPDNTKVTVGTQSAANDKAVSYADQVTITHGNQAYQVTGLSQENKAGLSVQKSNDGRALDAAAADGYTLQAARDGSGWIDPATGKAPTPDDIRKANA